MATCTLEITTRRQLFVRAWETSVRAFVDADAKPERFDVGVFVHQLFREAPYLSSINRICETFARASDKNHSLVHNLRGRPPVTFNRETTMKYPHQGEEELLFAAGDVLVPPASDRGIIGGSDQVFPFSLQIKTRFSHFTNESHIAHERLVDTTGPMLRLRPFINGLDVSRLVPFRLTEFRLGLELFDTAFFGSLLGFTPVITRRFYATLQPHRMEFELWGGRLRGRSQAPFSEQLISALGAALEKSGLIMGFSKEFARLIAVEKRERRVSWN